MRLNIDIAVLYSSFNCCIATYTLLVEYILYSSWRFVTKFITNLFLNYLMWWPYFFYFVSFYNSLCFLLRIMQWSLKIWSVYLLCELLIIWLRYWCLYCITTCCNFSPISHSTFVCRTEAAIGRGACNTEQR